MTVTAMGTFPILDDARPRLRAAEIPLRPAPAERAGTGTLHRIPAEAWICTALLALQLSGLLAPTWH